MEREPRLSARSGRPGRPKDVPSSLDPAPAVPFHLSIADSPREHRLRKRIDALLHARHVRDLRIRELEQAVRDGELPFESRAAVLEARLKHAHRRIIALNEQLREARRVA